jgi:beta-galactosidase
MSEARFDDGEEVRAVEHPCGFIHIDLPIVGAHRAEEVSKDDQIHTFPSSTPDWSNLEILHRNTLPPRASFFVYENECDAYSRDVTKSKILCLSGEWKFHLSKSPFDTPPDFFSPKFDPSSWGTITVPGMWQLQGFGKGPQ